MKLRVEVAIVIVVVVRMKIRGNKIEVLVRRRVQEKRRRIGVNMVVMMRLMEKRCS